MFIIPADPCMNFQITNDAKHIVHTRTLVLSLLDEKWPSRRRANANVMQPERPNHAADNGRQHDGKKENKKRLYNNNNNNYVRKTLGSD
jgi:hypothetical protein